MIIINLYNTKKKIKLHYTTNFFNIIEIYKNMDSDLKFNPNI